MSDSISEPVFTGINHICIVTGDIDRTVRVWADRYRIGPWRVHTYPASLIAAQVDGKPEAFAIRVGFCRFAAGTRIELIQPLDDHGPYARSLTEHAGADHLHHLRLDVSDFAASLDRLTGLGLRESLSAVFTGPDPSTSATAKYLSTGGDLGFTTEIAAVSPGFSDPPLDYVYPAPST